MGNIVSGYELIGRVVDVHVYGNVLANVYFKAFSVSVVVIFNFLYSVLFLLFIRLD